VTLDFPLWARVSDFFNLLFLSLLMWSGLEIPSAYPTKTGDSQALRGAEPSRLRQHRHEPKFPELLEHTVLLMKTGPGDIAVGR
jgi:hypothetical protein